MRTLCLMGAAMLLPATPAAAADVVFNATLLNSCVLSISTPGTLAATSDGTMLTSETAGGSAAVLTVVAVGLSPTLTFGAPTLQTPNGFAGTPSTMIRYQSASGRSQAYTASGSTMTGGALIDSVTVNSRVENPVGFASGAYAVRSTVTCQQ